MDENETEIRGGIRRWLVKQLAAILLFSGACFMAAGTIAWLGGWLLLGLLASQLVFTVAFLLPRHRELYAERSKLQAGTKGWDIPLSLVVAYSPLFMGIVGGLDARWHWTQPLPLALRLSMSGVAFVGLSLLMWAMAVNDFFSGTVRIQTDRAQTVATSGPYRTVRHPGYAGALLLDAGIVFMMGSVWCLVPFGVFIVFLVLRTALEDRTLRAELPGYAAYCKRTRYRLLPGIW